jgi:argininosuccinate lyase
MAAFMLHHLQVNPHILDDPKYEYLFTVEEVNRRVQQGVPFREAYQAVGEEVNKGRFRAERSVCHTHAGTIGNLCTKEIRAKFLSLSILSDEWRTKMNTTV